MEGSCADCGEDAVDTHTAHDRRARVCYRFDRASQKGGRQAKKSSQADPLGG